jgi:glutamyl-tRNA synthetase
VPRDAIVASALDLVVQPLRKALTGSTVLPGIFDVLSVLGPSEAYQRLVAAGG